MTPPVINIPPVTNPWQPQPPEESTTPALVLFTQFLAALKEVELPEVWHTQLSARLMALKPELPSDDFQRFVAHLKAHSSAAAQLSEMEASINDLLLDLVADKLPEYSALQICLDESTNAAEAIARAHPEWFDASKTKSRTIATPYGSAKMQSSSALEVADEAKSLEALKSLKVQQAIASHLGRLFAPEQFRRESVTLNLEALETLSDDVLAKLKIERVSKENFSIKPFKVPMAASVKAIGKREKKKEVAA